MLVRIANLIFASGALLISVMALTGARWAGSPPPTPHIFTVREFVGDLVISFWFAGAIGLFFRKRLAWISSLVGVGTSVCFIAVAFATIIGLYLFPNEDMHHLRDIGGSGYIAALVIAIVEFSVLLALFSALFIGLFKMRKDLR
jgi:uncharacterized membrane protein